ncbi:MAG: hypothetical protein HDT44_01125 [Ruminococcaceae bacterium]|nr:hypothetical protein [Oscillospiraceae bacterium]
MKLKNPKLETSFSFVFCHDVYYATSLEIYCRYIEDRCKVYYFLRAHSYRTGDAPLDMVYETAEEAYSVADKICSEYPPIEKDFDSFPAFQKDKFINY